MKWLIGLLIATAIAWDAGEQHRSNCIREGRTSCSVLPWDNGNAKPAQRRPRRQRGRRASLSGGTLTGFTAASSAGTSALRALNFRIVPGWEDRREPLGPGASGWVDRRGAPERYWAGDVAGEPRGVQTID